MNYFFVEEEIRYSMFCFLEKFDKKRRSTLKLRIDLVNDSWRLLMLLFKKLYERYKRLVTENKFIVKKFEEIKKKNFKLMNEKKLLKLEIHIYKKKIREQEEMEQAADVLFSIKKKRRFI